MKGKINNLCYTCYVTRYVTHMCLLSFQSVCKLTMEKITSCTIAFNLEVLDYADTNSNITSAQ